MTYEEAVAEIAENLRTNRQGTYGVAVRIQNLHGHNADKLMVDAAKVQAVPRMPTPNGAAIRAAVDGMPDAEALQTRFLSDLAEIYDNPSPETYALVNVFCHQLVTERDRLVAIFTGMSS